MGQAVTAWLGRVGQRFIAARQSVAAHWRLRKVLLALSVALLGLPVLQNFAFAAIPPSPFPVTPATPNHYDPTKGTTSVIHLPPAPADAKGYKAPTTVTPIPRPGVPHPAPLIVPLTATAATLKTADGRLSLSVPAGTVTDADRLAAGGTLSARVIQILPESGSLAGGSGLVSLGTYVVQLVDAKGFASNQGWRQPITVTLHLTSRERALALDKALVSFNSNRDLSAARDLAVLAPVAQGGDPLGAFGAPSTGATTYDADALTLSVTLPTGVAGGAKGEHALISNPPNTSFTWVTNSTISAFGSPSSVSVDLGSGGLTTNQVIDVPPGPDGLSPTLALAYSSEAVAEQHSPMAANSWVGQGWSLGGGAITWSEINATSSTSSTTWEDQWQLSDPYGTSAQLIPPNSTTSTYYDDTSHGISGFPNPVQWQTAPQTDAKIYSYNGPVAVGDPHGVTPPCFRVWLANGILEQYGCTSASVLRYSNTNTSSATYGLPVVYAWLLDGIIDPKGNQIHYTYQANTTPGYTVDTVLATVEWDSPNCHDNQNLCQGSSWQPLNQVAFTASQTPTRLTNTPANCNTINAGMRCDDPLAQSGLVGAPKIQSTYVLNDIAVQTRTCPNGNCTNWNSLRDYQLSYEQNGPGSTTDPATGVPESTAGYLDLTRIQEVGTDSSSTYSPTTFVYVENSTTTEYYEDILYRPVPATNCGPTWNTGAGGGCVLWAKTYDNSSRYLSSIFNGNNLGQDFFWANARNNTHGVSSGQSPTDTLACTTNQTTTSPCNLADDQNWSHMVLTERHSYVQRVSENGQGGTVTNTWVTSIWKYTYTLSTVTAKECGSCNQGMYWGNQEDNDYLDFYNNTFMGFAQTVVSNPDGSVETHKFNATLGYGVYDTSQITNCPILACQYDPWWDPVNATHGRETEVDLTDTNGTTPLRKETYQYAVTCLPSASTIFNYHTPATTYGSWDYMLVGETDPQNPVASCQVQTSQVDTYLQDGNTSSNVPDHTTTSQYDSYGRLIRQTDTSNDGGVTSPTTIVHVTQYVWNDSVTATANSATGLYLIDYTAGTDVENSDSSVHATCEAQQYDGQSFATGQSSGLTKGLVTDQIGYTSCGTAANGYVNGTAIHTTQTYDAWGNLQTTTDADATGGVAGHTGCQVNGSAAATTCTAMDTTFHSLPVTVSDVLGHTTTTGYTNNFNGGDGWWPTSSTDANGQVTKTWYDDLGRTIEVDEPGETLYTTVTSYFTWCATGTPGTAGTPCDEIDTTQRLDSGTVILQRAFYDGFGHLIETRAPAPGGQNVVVYNVYDYTGHKVAQSVPYFVTAYTGISGSAAFSPPDTTQSVTTYAYDGLDRPTSVTDPLSHTTTTAYQMDCGYNGDAACYNGVHQRDANGVLSVTFTDALGRLIYTEQFNSDNTPYSHVRYAYDLLGRQTVEQLEDGSHTTTTTYDAANRMTQLQDSDLGTITLTYDLDGNLLSRADPRGAGGTVYRCYDGLNRLTGIFTTNVCSGGTSLATYTYDQTNGGNQGIGRLTTETFSSGTSGTPISGQYTYTYDGRGRTTGWSQAMTGGATYSFSYAFNDASEQTSETYPTGDQLAYTYTQGWLSGATLTSGGTNTTLLNSVSYTGIGGASGQITSGQVANNTYTWTQSFDGLARLTGLTITAGANQPFLQTRSFDNNGNVKTVYTALPGGNNDNQAFCYDAQDRLTWAGDYGTPGCGGSAIQGTTLPTAGQYQQTYGYDTLDRLTSGPAGGSYTYGDANHLHAVTSTGSGYGASYDAAGNLTCRAPTSSQTCSGTPTGQTLSYDPTERQLTWQNAATNPTSTSVYGYDGSGTRVEQVGTSGGTTTTTVYASPDEEASTTNGTTTTTTYFFAGPVTAVKVGSTLSYLVHDDLGSVATALDGSGNVTATELYAPYGAVRYSTGTMPTSRGFTGQYLDTSGLNYLSARYYDPTVGQFTSADTKVGPNRYAYVQGNPETMTDPSGQCPWCIAALIGAVAGAAISYGSQVVSNVKKSGLSPQAFTHVDVGKILVAAAVGAVIGATGGAAAGALSTAFGVGAMTGVGGVLAEGAIGAATGAAEGAATQIADNVTNGRSWDTDLGSAALFGAATGGLGAAGGKAFKVIKAAQALKASKAAGAVDAAAVDAASGGATGDAGGSGSGTGGGCNSFDPATPVATPQGSTPIGQLQVGDQVVAYDSATGQTKAETVDHVFINHDTNLLDVTLAPLPTTTVAPQEDAASQKQAKAEVAAHGAQAPPTETVHTTTEHPFLTTDRGFVNAQDLHVGERVQRLDGSLGVVVAVVVTPGVAVRYNLTVHEWHTFAVGADQWVVHNCIPEDYDPHVPDYRVNHASQHAVDNGIVSDDFASRKAWLENAAKSNLRVSRLIGGRPGVAHLVNVPGYSRRWAVVFYADSDLDAEGDFILDANGNPTREAGAPATSIYPNAADYNRMMNEINK